MRVLLLATDIYGGHGGIALCNRNLVQALLEMPEIEEVVVIPRTIVEAPDGVPENVRFVGGAAGSKARFILHCARAMFDHYDLVICGHIHLLPLAALLNQYIRAPLAVMVHGIEVWQRHRGYNSWSLRSVDAIWSVSTITRDRMNAWARLPEAKYKVLPNTIHLEKYGMAKKRADLLQRYSLEASKVIMTLARLSASEQYKGLDEVLQLMPALLKLEPNLKYLIVGDGDDRPRLEAKATSLGLGENVIFAGMVSEADKADFFRLADVFVMPGTGEGFGFVFLEAMACGIPVVGSLKDGSREALREGMLGELVDPAEPRSIQQGILNALLRSKGIPEGLDHFAWPAFFARVSHAARTLLR